MAYFDGIGVHQFCMAFSSELTRTYPSTDPFWGFELQNVKNDLKLGEAVFCSFCERRGARVACMQKDCNIRYHLPCGFSNGTYDRFNGDSYISYCRDHKPIHKEGICSLCNQRADYEQDPQIVKVPCCKSTFHYDCVKDDVKEKDIYNLIICPNCFNAKDYFNRIEQYGVFQLEYINYRGE